MDTLGMITGKVEPVLAIKSNLAHDGVCSAPCHSWRSLRCRVNESFETHLGDHTGAFGRGFTHHVKQNTGRHIVGGNALPVIICQIWAAQMWKGRMDKNQQ